MKWNKMEWNGIKWNEMEWKWNENGMKWTVITFKTTFKTVWRKSENVENFENSEKKN